MIVNIFGRLIEKTESSVIVDVHGIYYEVFVPVSVLSRIDENLDPEGKVLLKTYHYIQIGPAKGSPALIGFFSDIERDFFQQFIKVSGIGPRAAVKALNQPISEIARAIAQGDQNYLKTLPGIGLQKAKEIVAKLQGKIGKYGLIKDSGLVSKPVKSDLPDWQEEALDVLLQLQYKKQEGQEMIRKALERSSTIRSAEELLNEIYKQRIMQ